MRILIVGANTKYAIENYYIKYLNELGADVSLFSGQGLFYSYYNRNIINKIIFKAGFSSIYDQINRSFRDYVANAMPQVIWIFKGMEISPESLWWVKEKKIKLVNYNPDNPFLFTGAGSGNKNITESISLYDLHFTYNQKVQTELQNRLNVKTSFLPFGFDVDNELFEKCSRQTEISRTCFLGNPDIQRKDQLLSIASSGIEIDVYGYNWTKFIKHDNIKIHAPVFDYETWRVLRRYRVQLNLMRIHNEDSHNMRTFEVPGIGGIMVAPDTTEHKLFFVDGKEVFLFKGVESCIRKINLVLGMSPEEVFEIRNAARTRSIISKYSYKNRAEHVLRELKILLSNE
jgi:spore maturation protein CgeB